MRLTGYERMIVEATGCTPDEAPKVEDVMRHTIFHSTLDWQPRDVFDRGARDAYDVVKLAADMGVEI